MSFDVMRNDVPALTVMEKLSPIVPPSPPGARFTKMPDVAVTSLSLTLTVPADRFAVPDLSKAVAVPFAPIFTPDPVMRILSAAVLAVAPLPPPTMGVEKTMADVPLPVLSPDLIFMFAPV